MPPVDINLADLAVPAASTSILTPVPAKLAQGNRPMYSDKYLAKLSRGLFNDIDLLVCDMAGTTVEEGGVVYKVLRESMVAFGLPVTEHDMHPWHGAKKGMSATLMSVN